MSERKFYLFSTTIWPFLILAELATEAHGGEPVAQRPRQQTAVVTKLTGETLTLRDLQAHYAAEGAWRTLPTTNTDFLGVRLVFSELGRDSERFTVPLSDLSRIDLSWRKKPPGSFDDLTAFTMRLKDGTVIALMPRELRKTPPHGAREEQMSLRFYAIEAGEVVGGSATTVRPYTYSLSSFVGVSDTDDLGVRKIYCPLMVISRIAFPPLDPQNEDGRKKAPFAISWKTPPAEYGKLSDAPAITYKRQDDAAFKEVEIGLVWIYFREEGGKAVRVTNKSFAGRAKVPAKVGLIEKEAWADTLGALFMLYGVEGKGEVRVALFRPRVGKGSPKEVISNWVTITVGAK